MTTGAMAVGGEGVRPSPPVVITHSDIKNFLDCRRAWYWDFISDYRKPEKLIGPLALGTRVHKSIEGYYAAGRDPIALHDEMAAADVKTLEAEDAPPWDLDKLYEDIIIGRNCVTAHQEWLADEGADDAYEIVGVEETVEAPILGGKVLLRGKVDKKFRRKTDGAIVIDDTKTEGGWEGGTRERMERSYQHHCYLVALRLAHPEEYIAEASYTVLRKVKTKPRTGNPMVRRFRVPGTTRTAPTKLQQIEAICTDMLAMKWSEAYPHPSHICQWCDYRHPCEVVDESVPAAKAMLDNTEVYIRGGRHRRYT